MSELLPEMSPAPAAPINDVKSSVYFQPEIGNLKQQAEHEQVPKIGVALTSPLLR